MDVRNAIPEEVTPLDLEATMQLDARVVTREPAAPLVVADRTIDAEVVAARCRHSLAAPAAAIAHAPAREPS